MAQRRARTSDRDKAVEAINEAYVDGQLSSDERHDRVAKALEARTLAQLERVTVDLQPHPAPSAPTPAPAPKQTFREQYKANAAKQREEWREVPRWQKRLIAAIAVVCVGGIGVGLAIGPGDDPSTSYGQTVIEVNEKGLAEFVTAYEAKFDTTEVVSASFARDNVVLKVPTSDGKARHEQWTYRDGEFERTAAARANYDGEGPIDLAAIDLNRLQTNIATARRTLGVEKPSKLLVWVERDVREKRPSVRIQVGNRFAEVGMVVTDPSGREVIDRLPFKPAAS